jgi:hypothetical protein
MRGGQLNKARRGYIDWERFEANQRRLTDNAAAFGGERLSGPAREGPALLQGRVLCEQHPAASPTSQG